MNKHIFISKGTLDFSRNRNQRRLEASLDNQNKSILETPNKKQNYSDTLGENCSKSLTSFSDTLLTPREICKYSEFCNVRKFGRINCLAENTIKTCQTYKFYEKEIKYKLLKKNGIY